MPQQLNLLTGRQQPAALRGSARQGALGLAALLLACLGAAQGLGWAADRAARDAAAAGLALGALRGQHQALSAAARPTADLLAELARLRAVEAGQQRVAAALAVQTRGATGAGEGPAEYLAALARQAGGGVWITGFSLSDDAGAVTLDGRLREPGALADYLRRLDTEPRFKGRPFAQLSLGGVDSGSGAALPYTAFSLRSTPVAAPATPAAADARQRP